MISATKRYRNLDTKSKTLRRSEGILDIAANICLKFVGLLEPEIKRYLLALDTVKK